jgi:hypothetical protein
MQPQSSGWESQALDYEVEKRRASMGDARSAGGWRDWAMFAAVLMLLSGGFTLLDGVSALLKDEVLVNHQGQVVVFDLTAWGWTHVIVGALVILAGIAVTRGHLWGRIIGVIMASLDALIQFAFLPVQPVWSVIVIAMNVAIILALTVHGRDIA